MSIRTKLGDWWRGYTNEDLLSLSEKLRDKREPGPSCRYAATELGVTFYDLQPH